MSKVKKFSGKKLDKLYEAYDDARRKAKEAENDKCNAGDEIKTLLGDVEEASTPNYTVTYAYDKFQEKDPKGYKVYQDMLDRVKAICKIYTKRTVVKGARKLVVTALAE